MIVSPTSLWVTVATRRLTCSDSNANIYPSIPYPYVPAESDFVDGYYSSIGCCRFCGARRRMARRLTIRFRKICVIGHDYTHPPLTARRKQTETDVNYTYAFVEMERK